MQHIELTKDAQGCICACTADGDTMFYRHPVVTAHALFISLFHQFLCSFLLCGTDAIDLKLKHSVQYGPNSRSNIFR